MSLSPETHQRLASLMARALCRPFLDDEDRSDMDYDEVPTERFDAAARAALDVILKDPHLTIIEGARVERALNERGLGRDAPDFRERIVGPWCAVPSPENGET